MSKIRDLMELNYWLGNRSRKSYDSVMQERRYQPQDRKSVLQELERLKASLQATLTTPAETSSAAELP